MESVILGLLIIQNLTLYELNRAFKQGVSMFYSASYGSLQVALRSLLGKGLVTFSEVVERGRNKKIYSITEAGRAVFSQWMQAETPLNKLEVTALSKVFFLGLVESPEQRRQIVAELLEKVHEAQAQLEALNGQLSSMEVPQEYQGIFKYQMKTLNYGRLAHQLAADWLAAVDQDLE